MASTKALGLLTLCMLLASICCSAAEVLQQQQQEQQQQQQCYDKCLMKYPWLEFLCSIGCFGVG